jgi:hypothetical protein
MDAIMYLHSKAKHDYQNLHNLFSQLVGCYWMPNILIFKAKLLMTKISSYNSYEHIKLKLHLVGDLQIWSCTTNNDSKTLQLGGGPTKSDEKGLGWHPMVTSFQ